MSFLDFYFSSNWERKYIKFGYKGEMAQSYLSYFSTGFHWRIFLLSRANRLYSIFLHWLEEPGVPRVSDILLSSTRNTGYGSSATSPAQKLTILLFTSAEGKESPLPFWGHSQSFGFSLLLPSGVWRPEVAKYQHLLISPLWPTFSLNGHFFDGFPLFIPTGG